MKSRKSRRCRPSVEVLETRLAPATRIWDGGGVTNVWSDRFNWASDIAPLNNDDLVFPDRTVVTVDPTSLNNSNNIAGLSVNSITFNDSTYHLTGSPVVLGAGGMLSDIATGPASNDVGFGMSVSTLRNFTVMQSSSDLRITGTISGAGGIIKDGFGTLRIHGNNTFTGQVIVGQGTLQVASATALGAVSGNTAVLTGATLEARLVNGLSISEPLSLAGNGVSNLGALQGGNANTWAGPITLAGDTKISGDVFILSGVIAGGAAAGVTFTGPSLFVRGVNTYLGFTTIEAGTVRPDAAGLGSAASGTRVLAGGGISLPDDAPLHEPLFVNGIGDSGFGALIGVPGSAPITVAGDIVVESNTTINVQNSEQVTFTGSINGNPAATLRKIGNGNLIYRIDADENVTFAGTTLVDDGMLTLNTPGRNVIAGPLFIQGSSANDSATVRLLGQVAAGIQIPQTGNNQIANNVTVSLFSGGVLDLNDNSDTIGGLNMTGGLADSGAGTLTLAGNVTANQAVGHPNARISGTLSLGSASRTITTGNAGSDATLTIDAAIVGAAGVNLIKEGAGSLHLAGNNTYAGLTILNDGVLEVSANNSLGGSGSTTVNPGATLLLFADNPLTINEIIQLQGMGHDDSGALFVYGNATLTSTINLLGDTLIDIDPGSFLTHSGNLNNGSGADLDVDGGTLRLTGSANVFLTGVTRLFEGTLLLDKTSTIGPIIGDLEIFDGTVRLLRPEQIGNSSMVTNVLSLLDLGVHAETIGGLNLLEGQVIVGGAPLVITNSITSRADNDPSVILGPLSLGNGAAGTARTITVEDGSAAADLVIAGTITDGAGSSIGLNKAGPGTLVFNGSLLGDGFSPNTYGGVTRVLDGILQLNHANGVTAVPGDLIVGDNIGAPVGDPLGTNHSARVVLSSAEQVANPRTVQVNQDGRFDLNGFDETITNVVMMGGRIETGAGRLMPTGSVRSLAAPVPAIIDGKLHMSDSTDFTILPFDVADAPAVSDDLIVKAVISGTSVLHRTGGTGRLVLSAANTYSGLTLIDHGVLDLRGGSLNNSDVRVATNDANIRSAVLVGPGAVKSLNVVRGVVSPNGTLTVNGIADFAANGSTGFDSILDILVNGEAAGQFARIVADGIDIGNGTTELQTRLTADVTPGVEMPILVNTSNQLTTGRFKNLPDDPDAFIAFGPDAGETTPFFVDYAEGDGNEVHIYRNTPSMFPNRAVTPLIQEGGTVTLTGNISDADATDSFILDVNWGDGSTQSFTFAPGTQTVSIPHRYQDDPSGADDRYVIKMSWRDSHGEGNRGELTTTVQNVAPTIHSGGKVSVHDNGKFERVGKVSDAGADRLRATVDYGDGGGAVPLDLKKDGTFELGHKYRAPGVYRVTVAVYDDDGGVGTQTIHVTANRGVTLDAGSPFAVTLNGDDVDGLKVKGTINLNNAPLDVTVNGDSRVGEQFHLIKNDGHDPIIGTFADMPEGSMITVNRQLFRISYLGGDGNDVVLEHVNTAPMFTNRSISVQTSRTGVAVLSGVIVEPDPLDIFTFTVDYGDGSRVETYRLQSADLSTLRLEHQYRAPGTYFVSLRWTDQHGAGNAGTLFATVDYGD